MADKKVIAVVGATGAQGGGVVRAILNDPTGGFAARAIVRDVNSEKATQLAAAGLLGSVRRILRHLLLGTLLARARNSQRGGPGPRRQTRWRPARHLVYLRRRPHLRPAQRQSYADASGEI
jgi:hypothetical protein